MTRTQLETLLNEFGAMQPRPGTFTMAAGKSVTFHVAHGGTAFVLDKIRAVRFEEDVLVVETAGNTWASVAQSVFAAMREG